MIASRSNSPSSHYRHTKLTEDDAQRSDGLDALEAAVAAAHQDAAGWIERALGDSLPPLDPCDVAANYPDGLHTLTLQGYLGEVFAGVLAENFQPHGYDWEVPAYLFRFHQTAIESLDRRLQFGGRADRIPGRTGDDCIAFVRDTEGHIVAWLNCEAKCSADHSASLIAKGHDQVSRPLRRGASTLALIDVMLDSDDPAAPRWVAALRLFRRAVGTATEAERADLLVYVCGRGPVDGGSWVPRTAPHVRYSARVPLEAMEVHLTDVDDVLVTVYPDHTINRD